MFAGLLPTARLRIAAAAAILICTVACMRRVHGPDSPTAAQSPSFLDVKPGSRLRVLVPLVKSGGYGLETNCRKEKQGSVVCSAPNLVGFQMAFYVASDAGRGEVKLHLDSVQTTVDGKPVPGATPVPLPFALPQHPRYIRLLYLVRVSGSDHDMAILSATNSSALNVLTTRVQSDPGLCGRDRGATCTWVPEGISVRPE